MPRSLASALGPIPAGWMLDLSNFGWPLICTAVLKAMYDVLLLVQFGSVPPVDELSTDVMFDEAKSTEGHEDIDGN